MTKLEKLRKLANRVPELQHENESLRQAKAASDKAKLQVIKERTDMEEERFLIA